MLDVIPYLLVGVEFGRVRRQEEQPEPSVLTRDKVAHRAASVDRMPVQNQKHRLRSIVHQAAEELRENSPVHAPFTSMKRNSPRALTAESMFTEWRPPVRGTTGVLPLTPQVVPAW